jgi:hypothetical protein
MDKRLNCYTVKNFAQKMDVSERTVRYWLKAGIVPGAKKRQSPAGEWWEIPVRALKMNRPKMGPSPKGMKSKIIFRQNHMSDDVVWAFKPGAELDGNSKLITPLPKKMREICARLIEIGGERVVCYLEGPFEFLHPLVWESGALIKPMKTRLKLGDPSRCYANSMALLEAAPKKYRFGIGWGLSENIWRPHAWVMDMKNVLIETTEVRDEYYGAVLSALEMVERMEM